MSRLLCYAIGLAAAATIVGAAVLRNPGAAEPANIGVELDGIGDGVVDAPPRGEGVRFIQKILQPGAKLRPHQLFARARGEDYLDGVAHTAFQSGIRDPAVLVRQRQERPVDGQSRNGEISHCCFTDAFSLELESASKS